ncbi:MAG: carbonic anhydrase [Thermoproteota archaeon]|nr:carbonic anhydrase [Thermoproteota archaeon]
MSNIQDMLNANGNYASEFRYASLKAKPLKKVAVLACMDARLNIENILGLNTGEANIIRNAGGIATEDAIRSLIVSHHLLGTEKFIVINHTDCGMQKFTDEDIRNNLKQKLDTDPNQIRFHTFVNLEENVKEQVQKIKASPFLPQDIPVYGFVYNTQTGRLEKIA